MVSSVAGTRPPLRGSGDERLPDGGAHLAHRRPVLRRREAAGRELRAVLRLIGVCLLDDDAAPVHVELVGDDHRQHVLHALTDLRVLADDRDLAVGGELDERVGRQRWPATAAALGEQVGVDVEGDDHAAAGEGGDLDEGATSHRCFGHGSSYSAAPRADAVCVSRTGPFAASLMAARMRT